MKLLKVHSIKIISFILLSALNVEAHQVSEENISAVQPSYIESKNELNDYILDTGDTLEIEFINAPELSGLFRVNEQGEIYFERLKYAYVRGLTINELTDVLEKRYEKFLIDPDIYIRIYSYKPIRVAVKGEVRSPGLIAFPAFTSTKITAIQQNYPNLPTSGDLPTTFRSDEKSFNNAKIINSKSNSITTIKRGNDYITTLSNAIQKAGGLTSFSDISKIEIVRDIPIGKGGGRKRAIIDFTPYITKSDTTNDIRLYDGDLIFIPVLKAKDPNIIPSSILSGLSPKFINVSITGRIENPGTVKIPIEGSLSDVMNLTGPRKPLSGKVYLIRYQKDGTLLRESIKYSASAAPGSKYNPYLFENDLIAVNNSILGRTSGAISAVTEPFLGIFAAKELIEKF